MTKTYRHIANQSLHVVGMPSQDEALHDDERATLGYMPIGPGPLLTERQQKALLTKSSKKENAGRRE